MEAIVTKYHAATPQRPERMKATHSAGSLYHPMEAGVSDTENARLALAAWFKRFAPNEHVDDWVTGHLEDGSHVHVYAPTQPAETKRLIELATRLAELDCARFCKASGVHSAECAEAHAIIREAGGRPSP